MGLGPAGGVPFPAGSRNHSFKLIRILIQIYLIKSERKSSREKKRIMASSAEKEKNIVLRSWDGEEFEVEEATARQSEVIANVIDDGCAEKGIPLYNVDARTLARVIEYCRKHAGATSALGDDRNADEKIKRWDAEYIDVDQAILYNLLLAANYLEIKGLLDLACNKVADMIRGKSVEEIRKTFNIRNDFTPEEEEAIQLQNRWAFE